MRQRCTKKEEIIELRKNGVQFTDICEQTGVPYATVKNICYRNGVYREKRVSMKKQMETDRLTMTAKEVAAKYNRNIRTVNQATQDSPLKHLFKFTEKVKKEKVKVAKPKPVKPPKPITLKVLRKPKKKVVSPTKDEVLKKMNIGEVKLRKDETVFKTKVHDINQQRSINLNDPKNTTIFVKLTDIRTDDEIRNAYLNR